MAKVLAYHHFQSSPIINHHHHQTTRLRFLAYPQYNQTTRQSTNYHYYQTTRLRYSFLTYHHYHQTTTIYVHLTGRFFPKVEAAVEDVGSISEDVGSMSVLSRHRQLLQVINELRRIENAEVFL